MDSTLEIEERPVDNDPDLVTLIVKQKRGGGGGG